MFILECIRKVYPKGKEKLAEWRVKEDEKNRATSNPWQLVYEHELAIVDWLVLLITYYRMIMLTFTTWIVASHISSAFVSSPHYHVRHSNSILHKASRSVQSEQHSFSFDEIKAVESRYVVSCIDVFICIYKCSFLLYQQLITIFICIFFISLRFWVEMMALLFVNGAGVDSNISKENHPMYLPHSMDRI